MRDSDGVVDPVVADAVAAARREGLNRIVIPLEEGQDPRDLIDRIDEIVAAYEARVCGCGCGKALGPADVSADFASELCQLRWHERQADGPQEVPVIPAQGGPMLERGHVDRSRPPGRRIVFAPTYAGGSAAADREPPVRARPVALPQCDDLHGAAYRRHCPTCAAEVIPVVYADPDTSWTASVDGVDIVQLVGVPMLRCPHCDNDLPGLPLIAQVTQAGGRLQLRLRDAGARTARTLPVAELARVPDPAGLIRRTWAALERELQRFRRAWTGGGRPPEGS